MHRPGEPGRVSDRVGDAARACVLTPGADATRLAPPGADATRLARDPRSLPAYSTHGLVVCSTWALTRPGSPRSQPHKKGRCHAAPLPVQTQTGRTGRRGPSGAA